MKIFFYIAAFIILGFPAFGQEDFPRDSVLDLDKLDYDSLDVESDFLYDYHISYGWFPVPIPGMTTLWLDIMPAGFMLDQTDGIKPAGFVDTGMPYVTNTSMTQNQREFRSNFLANDKDKDYPSRSHYRFGLTFEYSPGYVPVTIQLRAGVNFNSGMLYSEDKSKQFLNRDDEIEDLKEVGIVNLYEFGLNGGLSLKVPFYGGFVSIDENSIGASYYFSFGISAFYPLVSDATQYLQIALPKDEIRYPNGRDTLHLMTDEKLEKLNWLRPYAEFAIGTDISGSGIGLGLSLEYSVPLRSVLKDAVWRQHMIRINGSIALDALLGLIF